MAGADDPSRELNGYTESPQAVKENLFSTPPFCAFSKCAVSIEAETESQAGSFLGPAPAGATEVSPGRKTGESDARLPAILLGGQRISFASKIRRLLAGRFTRSK